MTVYNTTYCSWFKCSVACVSVWKRVNYTVWHSREACVWFGVEVNGFVICVTSSPLAGSIYHKKLGKQGTELCARKEAAGAAEKVP